VENSTISLLPFAAGVAEWKRGRAIIFIARSAGALTYVAVE